MIEVKTILNAPTLRKFNQAQIKSKLWMPLIVMTVLLAAGVVCLFVVGPVCGIPVICVGVLVPVAFYLVSRLMLRKLLASSPAVKNETTVIVRFYDKIMINESSKYTTATDTQIDYDSVTKAVEREEAFYLYVGAQVYILDTKGFRAGSRRELHYLLLDKLGGKRFRYQSRLYAKK